MKTETLSSIYGPQSMKLRPGWGGMMINRCMVPYSLKKKHGKSVVQSPPLGANMFSAGNGDTMLSMSALETPDIITSSDAVYNFQTSM
jgi:hypothetical protein